MRENLGIPSLLYGASVRHQYNNVCTLYARTVLHRIKRCMHVHFIVENLFDSYPCCNPIYQETSSFGISCYHMFVGLRYGFLKCSGGIC